MEKTENRKEGMQSSRQIQSLSGKQPQTRVQLPIFDKTLTEEVSEEVTLPDYQPEIRRLLRVGTTLSPAEHYVGGGAVEFSGNVDFCILYVGSDGEMYCHPVSTEYRFRVPLEAGSDFDLNDGLVVYAENESESASGRVLGPRRLSLRCKIRSRARAFGICVIEEKGAGTSAEAERLMKETRVCRISAGQSAPQTLTEEILLERQEGLSFRILNGDAALQMTEVNSGDGKVSCRGNLLLSVLLVREGGTPEQGSVLSVNRKLPFSAEAETEGAGTEGDAIAQGFCTELRLSLEEGRLLCEAEIVVEAIAQQAKPFSYTADWFAVGRKSSCTVTIYDLPRCVACINGQFSQNSSLSAEEAGIPAEILSGALPLEISGRAFIENVVEEKGKLCLTGKCRYTLLIAREDEISSREIELPFRYMTDVTFRAGESVNWDGGAVLLSARVRMDGERIAVDGEIGISVCVRTTIPVGIVTGTETGEPCPGNRGETVLFYPGAGETLWQVAKEYCVPLSALRKQNAFPDASDTADTPASLEGVHFLTVRRS